MAQQRSMMRNLFAMRTSYFNTNIQAAAANSDNSPFYELGADNVDNTTKRRRKRANNQDQQATNDEKKNNNSTTVVEVTNEVQMVDEDQQETTAANDQIENTDVISDILGHFGWWQFIWALTLSLFQFPSTFHLFSFVFEVSECCKAAEVRGHLYILRLKDDLFVIRLGTL